MSDTERAAALYQEGDTIAEYRARLEGNGFETQLTERPSTVRSGGGVTETTTAYVMVWTTGGWVLVGPPFTGTS